jgi:polyvinyl alcohol dehydrogenase (cytochrome)
MKRFVWCAMGALLFLAAMVFITPNSFSLFADSTGQPSQWPIAGQNLNNWRSQDSEHTISPVNAGQLSTKWTFTTSGDVSATPTVAVDAVYFPDWGGNLYAVDRDSGALKWARQISEYDAHKVRYHASAPPFTMKTSSSGTSSARPRSTTEPM